MSILMTEITVSKKEEEEEEKGELREVIRVSVTPLQNLHPIIQKQLLDIFKRYTFEDFVIALLLKTILMQTDKKSLRNPKINQILRKINKITHAASYVGNAVAAANKIWYESFTQLECDVSITEFVKILTKKHPKTTKRIGLNPKKIIELRRDHKDDGYVFITLKLVNLMNTKIQEAVAQNKKQEEFYNETKKK